MYPKATALYTGQVVIHAAPAPRMARRKLSCVYPLVDSAKKPNIFATHLKDLNAPGMAYESPHFAIKCSGAPLLGEVISFVVSVLGEALFGSLLCDCLHVYMRLTRFPGAVPVSNFL